MTNASAMNRLPVNPNPRRLARALQIATVGVSLLLGSCGGAALFVPYFTFGFTGTISNVNNAPTSVSMSLKPSDDCSTSGTLPGTAKLSLANGTESPITGNYQERSVTITLTNPPPGLAAIYDGQFQDRDTLTFTPRGNGVAFTVTRIDVGVPVPACT